MIIRISTEGQYELKGEGLQALDALDDTLLDAISAGEEAGYDEAFAQVISLIRSQGTRLADTELCESDLILPSPDTTLAEARDLFEQYPRHLLR